MYIHALVTIVLERAWAALKCDQLPVFNTKQKKKKKKKKKKKITMDYPKPAPNGFLRDLRMSSKQPW